MAHGTRKLKHIDFSRPDKQTADNLSKGRSKELLQRRNEAIVARYYYHNVVKRISYADTLATLVLEFWLTGYTISKVLEKRMEEVKQLRKDKPNKLALKKQFPMLPW